MKFAGAVATVLVLVVLGAGIVYLAEFRQMTSEQESSISSPPESVNAAVTTPGTFAASSPSSYPQSSSARSAAICSTANCRLVSCEVQEWIGGPGTIQETIEVTSIGSSTFTTTIVPNVAPYSSIISSYSTTSTTTGNYTMGYVTQNTFVEDPGNWQVSTCTYIP